MEIVSQREMRNRSGDLLRRVAAGERVRVTNDGVPAADLVPVHLDAVERLRAQGRLSTGRMDDFADLPEPVDAAEPIDAQLSALRDTV